MRMALISVLVVLHLPLMKIRLILLPVWRLMMILNHTG